MWENSTISFSARCFRFCPVQALGQDVQPDLRSLGYREKAWCVNRLSGAARKHGFDAVAVSMLNSLYGYMTMDVQEAFVKIKEQVRGVLVCCCATGTVPATLQTDDCLNMPPLTL